MRERHAADVQYNVRCDGYDPQEPIAIKPVVVDLRLESTQTLVSWFGIRRKGGPVTLYLVDAVMALIPAREHSTIKFTARPELLRGFPANTPLSWHTDYAHSVVDAQRRQQVHNYALVTAGPGTKFLQESSIWLPNAANHDKLRAALSDTPHTPFQIAPWALVKFNATELHTAVPWTGREPSPRLFFRATHDAIRNR